MQALRKAVVKALREAANKIEAETCELSESEAMDIMSIISHQVMSKEDACIHAGLSRSRFDDLTREGRLPKGRKRRGFKELVYYKDELDSALSKIREYR